MINKIAEALSIDRGPTKKEDLIIGETQPERVFSTLERPARSVSAHVRNKQTRRHGDLAEVRGDKI